MNDARSTTEAEAAPRLDETLATVVYLGLIAYLIAASVRLEMSIAMEIGYGLCFVAAVGVVAVMLILRRPLDASVARFAQVAIVVSSLYLVPTALLPQGRTLRHMAVDFATTMLPIAFLLAICMAPTIGTRILDRRWVLLFFLASLYSPFIVQDSAGVARLFEPPSVGVIVLLAGFACLRAGERDGVAAVLALVALLGLAAFSGSRSVLLLGMSAFLVVMAANRAARLLAVLALLIGVVLLAANPDFQPSSLRRDDTLRFLARATDLQGLVAANDPSSSSRAFEAQQIFAEIGERGPLWMAVGVGHGAVFQPSEWHQVRTMSADGFVHNVHVGPVLMLFRYGIVGLGLYLLLLAHSGLVAFRNFPRQRPVVLRDLPRQRLEPHGAPHVPLRLRHLPLLDRVPGAQRAAQPDVQLLPGRARGDDVAAAA